MESYSTLAKWYQQEELISLASKSSWPSSVIVHSCHVSHPEALRAIFPGGNRPSNNQLSHNASQDQISLSTVQHTQMQAPKLALALSLAQDGMHGASYQHGRQSNETLARQKVSDSSSSSSQLWQNAIRRHTTESMETIRGLLRAGGKVEAETSLPTRFLNSSTLRTVSTALPSTPAMSPPSTILQTNHHVAFMALLCISSLPSVSHTNSTTWLLTLMQNPRQKNYIEKTEVTNKPPFPNQQLSQVIGNGESSMTDSNAKQRSFSLKCKDGEITQMPPAKPQNPPPYTLELRPRPSTLCPHVLA